MRRHLIVFARAPRRGRVKRRLAAGIGPLAALRFYRRTLASLIRRVARDGRWGCVLAVTHAPARWPRGVPRIVQRGRGLGERMANAMRDVPPGPVVLIGSDIPGISPRHIARAFRALGRYGAVFGPARDGGYWLVGLRDRALLERLFRDVRWSSEHALADTLANLRAGRGHVLVDELEDVDDVESYRRLLPKSASPAPAAAG